MVPVIQDLGLMFHRSYIVTTFDNASSALLALILNNIDSFQSLC